MAEKAERLAMAKSLAPTSDFNFPKIPLNPIVEAAFQVSLNNASKTP